MAQSPQELLQTLTELVLDVCRAESAGISVFEQVHGKELVRWRTLAGAFSSNIANVMPRDASPCGMVVERRSAALLRQVHGYYKEFARAAPLIVEALLVPLSAGGNTVGTVWLMVHDERRQFDGEDARIAENLTEFAGVAFHALALRDVALKERDDLARENQQLRESERQKHELLAIIGHELRNPLSGMQYAVSFLSSRHAGQPDVANALNLLQRQLQNTRRLVDDLFEASKLTRGNVQLIKERVDVASPVIAGIQASRTLLESMRHELTVKLPAEPVFLTADPARLTQIVSNLLNNAAKFTPEGGHIEVSAQREGKEAVIRVIDNGIGIPLDMLGRIFEMFAQVTRSSGSVREGLGIGLGVVKQLVEMHGGKVGVHSEGLGKGSEFFVRLPTAE
jgi:signal transduction histidine kinase